MTTYVTIKVLHTTEDEKCNSHTNDESEIQVSLHFGGRGLRGEGFTETIEIGFVILVTFLMLLLVSKKEVLWDTHDGTPGQTNYYNRAVTSPV